MIYDRIENIEKYRGISKWFDKAADFLVQTDLTCLPMGRTEILEEHVFANVMEVDTADEKEGNFEIHKRYWDIQLDIEGAEQVQVGVTADEVVDEFQTDIDFGTVSCRESISFVMGEGRFIVFMNEEPHKPTLSCGKCRRVKKCVIKVEVEGYEP